MNSIVPGVRKIAVLRANGIGDFMFALPALEALRRTYPQAEITLLGSDWHKDFLFGRPGPVDRVVTVPPSRGVREDARRGEDPEEMREFFERMRAERFDLAVQLHGGGGHSNPFVRRLGARLTAGLCSRDAEPLDRSLPYVYFQSEIIRYLETVSLVGASPVTLDPHIVVTDRDLEESMRVVPGGRGSSEDDSRLVLLHPSASDSRRRWPSEKFARVGAELRSRGFDVYVIGLGQDGALVREVVSGMGGDETSDLSGKLTLGGLAGLMSRAALAISNDSGPLHLAAAAGASTVGIYWCANVITAAPVMRARHRPVVSWRLACPRCGADAISAPCGHPDSFVADVEVEEVATAACDLLSEAGVLDEFQATGERSA